MKDKNQYTKNSILIVSLFCLLLCSCKKESGLNIQVDKVKHSQIFHDENRTVQFQFEFPDTVFVNKSYDGKIKYKGIFDTITTNVQEEIDGKNRYIVYALTKTNNVNYDEGHVKKMRLDTFGAIDHNTIPFHKIKFSQVGTHYIDGMITDQVLIDSSSIEKKSSDMVRLLTKEVRATKKVYVIKK